MRCDWAVECVARTSFLLDDVAHTIFFCIQVIHYNIHCHELTSVSNMTKVAMNLIIVVVYLSMHDEQDYDYMPPKRWLISALWFRCKSKNVRSLSM